MKRRSDLYVKDILEAITRIEQGIRDKDFAAFSKDQILSNAVLFELYKIGEASTQLPSEFKVRYPEVPWRDIQGFRVVVAHLYWKIELDEVWRITQSKLEPLRRQVAQILDEERQAA